MEGCNIEKEKFGFCKEHMPMRKCRDCGKVKPLTEYYYSKRKLKSGQKYIHHKPECRTCSVNMNRKWQLRNHEKYKAKMRKYDQRPEHKEKKRLSEQQRRESGKLREWQQNNKDKVKEYNETRRHKNHDIKNEEWDSCKAYFDYCCAYCGISEIEAKDKYNNYLHKEHVSHEGSDDLSNCIPACKVCNASKSTITLEEWYPKQDFYNNDRYEKINQWLNEDYKAHIN